MGVKLFFIKTKKVSLYLYSRLFVIKKKRFGVEKMTAMLKDESTRKKFVDDSVDFLKKFEFDGLDLDFDCNKRIELQ